MSKEPDLRPYGYAPGDYANKCITCKQIFTGDKRAQNCEDCALKSLEAAVDPATDVPKALTFDVYLDHTAKDQYGSPTIAQEYSDKGGWVSKVDMDAAIEKKNDHIRLLQTRLKEALRFTRETIRNHELIEISEGDDRLEKTLKSLETLGHTTGDSLEKFTETSDDERSTKSMLIFKTSTKEWPKKYKGDFEVVLREDAERLIKRMVQVIVSVEDRLKRFIKGSVTLENQNIRLEEMIALVNEDRNFLVQEKEAMRKAATDYCWERYKGRQPMMLKHEAVFTSHEWQKIGEYMDAMTSQVRKPNGQAGK